MKKIFDKNDLEITNFEKINTEILFFYENLFKKKNFSTKENLEKFLNSISLPTLTNNEKLICEGEITEKDCSLTNMENNKSPGNDGLTKEFYVIFWTELTDIFMSSIKESKKLQKLGVSQRQAIIKLIEKPNRDRRFLRNWRPISLLNVDQKFIVKNTSKKTKKDFAEINRPSSNCLCQKQVYW